MDEEYGQKPVEPKESEFIDDEVVMEALNSRYDIIK